MSKLCHVLGVTGTEASEEWLSFKLVLKGGMVGILLGICQRLVSFFVVPTGRMLVLPSG